ncbi:zinc/manganese transport system substrate-binding protein [Nakamurella flavida]|uniref:metal ABC transporter substrate-binding protein n=1 Tax=Nakamurella flavida TaxID=363630 RepID=UPI002788000B|nr:metal ABC transporter substrate-binding protein [Nakamurella flavida]MDP9778518.1 zinc/manganese transport system substrate-binding protein [Nakamurella flavida]
MRARHRLLPALLTATLLLGGCSGDASAPDRPLIAVSTNILGDVVREVIGAQADVLVLMPPGSDPHSFEISAQEAARLRGADLLVSNGLGLEEGVQHHLDAAAADGVPRFVAGDHVETVAYTDDEMSGPDPHLWTDPRRMLQVLDALEPALAALDAVDGPALHASAETYRQELRDLDAHLAELFATIPASRRALVTNHNVFGYLAQRYDFTVVGTVLPGGTTLAAPSASDFDDLIQDMATASVDVVFADVAQPERLMRVLADEADVQVEVVPLFTESLSAATGTGEDSGAATYLEMMRSNADRITAALAS